jgi:outer membrane protein assembly factor BamB
MQTIKNKTIAILIAAILFLSIGTSILIPNASAHSPPWNIPTYAYIEVNPNPAGVGQTVNVGFWMALPPPTASGPYGDRWAGLKVNVVQPDGQNQTLGPFTTDDTGGTHTNFVPATTGNYTFQMIFPGQKLAGNNLAPTATAATKAFIGDYYEPSMSPSYTLNVQSAATPTIPQAPLPTSFWSRPIYAVNNVWYSISGNWLGLGTSTFANTGEYNITSNYNPYTTAPTTAHILWTKPEAFGGVVGGEFGGSETGNFYSTSQYEPKFAPVIISGILYYTEYPNSNQDPTGITAVDLQTGKTLWTNTYLNSTVPLLQQGQLGTAGGTTSTGVVQYTTTLRCGEIVDYVSPNQYGSQAYLWIQEPAVAPYTGTTYGLWDALTGTPILNIVNAPLASGLAPLTLTEDQSGDLIGYYVNSTIPTAPTLNMWNSTQAILYPNGQAPAYQNWYWRPVSGSVIQFSAGIMWTVPLPTTLNGVPLPSASTTLPGTLAISSINSGVIFLTDAGYTGESFFQSGFEVEAGYNAANGQQLWITNRTETAYTRIDVVAVGYGTYAILNQETAVINAYNLNTGNFLWTTTLPNPNPYNSIGGYQQVLANGTLYIWGFGGDIWAVNMATGSILWQTNTNTISGPAGSDTPYGVWPLWTFTAGTVAGGMLFIPEGHMYSPPLFRGASQLAINCANGKLVWSILAFDVTSAPAVSDGIMTTLNAYDNQIYAWGMGPSKTTVSAPSSGVTTSSTITLSGTVTDVSAGSQQKAVVANFPNGLPCVSDASMTQFMEAVYEQQPMPTSVTGVPVTISVIDANGNNRVIGTTTTNANGFYSFNWKPDISGNFTVTATFAGTHSYYGSSANAAFYANSPSATAAPTASPAANYATSSDLALYMAVGVIAIVIAIAIVGVLILRRKP